MVSWDDSSKRKRTLPVQNVVRCFQSSRELSRDRKMSKAGKLKVYQNVHQKSDFAFTVQVPRILLTLPGIWPLHRGDSIFGDIRSMIQVGVIFLLMCYLLVPHVIYTFHDSEDLTRYMKVIAAQVFSLLGIVKFWVMIFKKKRFRACITEMSLQYANVESEEDRLVMKNSAKVARFFTTIYLGLCFGGAFPYHMIMPFLSEKVVKTDNTTQIPLPYLSNYVFFVIEDSPVYEITFAVQIAISNVILFINCGTNSLIASMTMHSCGMFKVVNRQLVSLYDGHRDEMKGCLRGVVRHHLKAIRFAELIETNLNTVFLTEMVGCTLIICFLEYGVIMEWEDKNMLSMVIYSLLMTWMFLNVYILSYIGDCLKQESMKVKLMAYCMPWYEYSEEVKKNLRIIMFRPSRPTCFTAAKFFELSLQAFCDVSNATRTLFNEIENNCLKILYICIYRGTECAAFPNNFFIVLYEDSLYVQGHIQCMYTVSLNNYTHHLFMSRLKLVPSATIIDRDCGQPFSTQLVPNSRKLFRQKKSVHIILYSGVNTPTHSSPRAGYYSRYFEFRMRVSSKKFQNYRPFNNKYQLIFQFSRSLHFSKQLKTLLLVLGNSKFDLFNRFQCELNFRGKAMTKPRTTPTTFLTEEVEHKTNVNLSLRWNRWILRPMGVWPNSGTVSGLDRCSSRLMNLVCYSLISFLFVPCWLFMTLEVENLYDKLKLFGPLSFCVMAYMKYYSLINHANDIRECVECIERDWRNVKYPKDREIMVANAKFGRRLVKICMFFMYSGFVFYYIALPIRIGRITVEEQNFTFIPMVFPMTKLMPDSRRRPLNEIFFSIQFFGGIVIHGVAAATCSLVAALAVHACGQVKILVRWLEHLIEGREDMSKSVDERIASIVSQHVRILKCVFIHHGDSDAADIFRRVYGMHVEFMFARILRNNGTNEWDPNDLTATVTYVTILISLGFNIFIFCYIGDLVAEHCNKVGEVAYMIDWYQLWGNRKRCLILIMAMSNCSTKLTAGKMVELSLSTFGDVVKTAVGFLNMLLALTQ
ncbi:uncharacterized protein LOC143352230 [Halictus rubicundus]|uniref:uncharacterized protein LOC143352230 n=1 Tax=Halictus rubicundus TaxID=77578 RepID=UPI004035EDB9